MRFLHRTGRVGVDLTARINGPVLYAYESIPSALSAEQISAVLKCARNDHSPMGYRDYAILLLLSTYGLRDGEIKRLRLEDIDWRAETYVWRIGDFFGKSVIRHTQVTIFASTAVQLYSVAPVPWRRCGRR
jgi:integrase